MRYEEVRKYRKVPHKDFISFSYSTVSLKTGGIYLLFRTMYLLLRSPPPFPLVSNLRFISQQQSVEEASTLYIGCFVYLIHFNIFVTFADTKRCARKWLFG